MVEMVHVLQIILVYVDLDTLVHIVKHQIVIISQRFKLKCAAMEMVLVSILTLACVIPITLAISVKFQYVTVFQQIVQVYATTIMELVSRKILVLVMLTTLAALVQFPFATEVQRIYLQVALVMVRVYRAIIVSVKQITMVQDVSSTIAMASLLIRHQCVPHMVHVLILIRACVLKDGLVSPVSLQFVIPSMLPIH